MVVVVHSMPRDYVRKRNFILTLEGAERTGGQLQGSLTRQEKAVDRILMRDKRDRVKAARVHGAHFPMNFLTSREDMKATTAFRILRKMPKGALLHVHKTTMVSLDWVVGNLTYRPHLYMCKPDTGMFGQFCWADHTPENCQWDLVANYRARSGNASAFDQALYHYFSLTRRDPNAAYLDINAVWDVFEEYFQRIKPVVSYTAVWRDYLWQALTELLHDKVQYVEIRGSLPKLYELDGRRHTKEWSIENVYKPVFEQFRRQYPAFIGAKLILTRFRGVSTEDMLAHVQSATRMYQSHPGLVVGFDIVGQEDRYRPLTDFVNVFMYPSSLTPSVHLPYFFHAGETDWQGTESDDNLVDALLLNATRIGHGYAVTKHPRLMRLVKDRETALEINPISNQVLSLVKDLRNHPAAVMLATDLPVVISSDDPAVWDALPLTHDFYMTFMNLMGEDTGLATLKQLALNSLK
ncbi:hypothetical protein ACOMHN_052303 [Nucella lapillus]